MPRWDENHPERRAARHSLCAFALWEAEQHLRLAARQLLLAGDSDRAAEATRLKGLVGAKRRRVMRGPAEQRGRA
jgi:hypothetical protein